MSKKEKTYLLRIRDGGDYLAEASLHKRKLEVDLKPEGSTWTKSYLEENPTICRASLEGEEKISMVLEEGKELKLSLIEAEQVFQMLKVMNRMDCIRLFDEATIYEINRVD